MVTIFPHVDDSDEGVNRVMDAFCDGTLDAVYEQLDMVRADATCNMISASCVYQRASELGLRELVDCALDILSERSQRERATRWMDVLHAFALWKEGNK